MNMFKLFYRFFTVWLLMGYQAGFLFFQLEASPNDQPSLAAEANRPAAEYSTLIAQAPPTNRNPPPARTPAEAAPSRPLREISINFNNIAMVEYIRFLSGISNKNFIFDEEDLQFNVTIVSKEPTSIENLMAALLQELEARDLLVIEQGNNILIHRNPRVRAPARIVVDGTQIISDRESELVTRVFRLKTLDPIRASEIIRPLLSNDALVEVLRDTNNLIITDLVTNVNKIAQLIDNLDAPNSGVTIGEYVVRFGFVESILDLATRLLQPIASGNPFTLIPHPATNSIYVVSNPFIVEKALAILENLDHNEGKTRILALEKLHPETLGTVGPPRERVAPPPTERLPSGEVPEMVPGAYPPGAVLPGGVPSPLAVPETYPFGPGGISTVTGAPIPGVIPPEELIPGRITTISPLVPALPVGHIARTLFFIYKLRYRRGDQVEIALRRMANSLQLSGANPDLISAINSSQWLESSNSLIFTGTSPALEKVKELILEIDTPLRQVFIEMLILTTTVADSLTYGVDWVSRFGGGLTTGEQGFQPGALVTSPVTGEPFNVEIIDDAMVEALNLAVMPFPVASQLLNATGYTGAIIGTHLTHHGTRFATIAALVQAIHTDIKTNILLNPKIITEDNNTAEIFVGETDRFKTQSITNDLGSLITNNFQLIDVGTTLRVTPLIGSNGLITLDIIQETTAPSGSANVNPNQINFDFNLVTVLTKSRTITRVHVPDGFFVVLSGQISDTDTRTVSQIPCLGGIPILGVFGKSQTTTDAKSNMMIFIRPLIINTDDEYEDVTKRQQDVFREKTKFRRFWNYEIDEALNFGNIKPTDPDEIGCTIK